MRAEYDSEARALWIELDPERGEPTWAGTADVAAGCAVALGSDGEAFAVELLGPGDDLAELVPAARRYGLDLETLRAAARAALEAPDREVRLAVGDRAAV